MLRIIRTPTSRLGEFHGFAFTAHLFRAPCARSFSPMTTPLRLWPTKRIALPTQLAAHVRLFSALTPHMRPFVARTLAWMFNRAGSFGSCSRQASSQVSPAPDFPSRMCVSWGKIRRAVPFTAAPMGGMANPDPPPPPPPPPHTHMVLILVGVACLGITIFLFPPHGGRY